MAAFGALIYGERDYYFQRIFYSYRFVFLSVIDLETGLDFRLLLMVLLVKRRMETG